MIYSLGSVDRICFWWAQVGHCVSFLLFEIMDGISLLGKGLQKNHDMHPTFIPDTKKVKDWTTINPS